MRPHRVQAAAGFGEPMLTEAGLRHHLDGSVGELFLATGFDHPDIVSFGVRGVSTRWT